MGLMLEFKSLWCLSNWIERPRNTKLCPKNLNPNKLCWTMISRLNYIKGQHIVEAMGGMMLTQIFPTKKILRLIVVSMRLFLCGYWTKRKWCTCSKCWNLKIHDKGARPTFFEDVSQGRASWVDNAKPQPTKLDLICVSFGRSPIANACTLAIFVEYSI